MHTSIRRANENDFEAILELLKEFATFQKTPEKVIITTEQMKHDQQLFHWFVATDATNTIIGFASCFFAYYSWIGKSLYLDDLYVKETARAQHTGTALLNTVIAFAKESGCKKLRWQVSNWNHNAIAFYKKMGAVIDDVEINCDLYL